MRRNSAGFTLYSATVCPASWSHCPSRVPTALGLGGRSISGALVSGHKCSFHCCDWKIALQFSKAWACSLVEAKAGEKSPLDSLFSSVWCLDCVFLITCFGPAKLNSFKAADSPTLFSVGAGLGWGRGGLRRLGHSSQQELGGRKDW